MEKDEMMIYHHHHHHHALRVIGLAVSVVALLVALKPRTTGKAVLPLATTLFLVASVLLSAGVGGKPWVPPPTYAAHIRLALQIASTLSSITLALAPSLASKTTTTAPISTLALFMASFAGLADCIAHQAFIPAAQASIVLVIAGLQLAGFRLCPQSIHRAPSGLPPRKQRLEFKKESEAKAKAKAAPQVLEPKKHREPPPPTAAGEGSEETSSSKASRMAQPSSESKEE